MQGSSAVENSFTATRSVAVQCGHESEGTMTEHAMLRMQKEFEELKSQQIMMDEEMLEKERELTQLHHELGQLHGKDRVLSTSGSPSTSVASSRLSLPSPAPHWSPAKPEVSLLQTLLNEYCYYLYFSRLRPATSMITYPTTATLSLNVVFQFNLPHQSDSAYCLSGVRRDASRKSNKEKQQ